MRIFKTCSEIFEYLKELNEEEIELESELNNLKCNIFDKTYRSNTSKRKKIRNKLDYIKCNVDYLTEFVRDSVTFDHESFLEFMIKLLGFIESKTYVVLRDVVSCYSIVPFDFAIFQTPIQNLINYYDVITSLDNAEMIDEYRTSSLYVDLSKIMDVLNQMVDKYICLSKNEKYCLLDGIELDSSYKRYPYLIRIAELLVDIKIQKPELSDIERLNMVLEKVKGTISEGKIKTCRFDNEV